MLTKFFNNLSQFAIDSILDTDSFLERDLSDEKQKEISLAEKGIKTRLKEAGRVAEFYGDVLNELRSSENGFVDINGSMAIQQGLKSSAINRLPLDLSKEVKDNIADFETLMSPVSNNKNLRDKYNELDKNKISYIPYQGMFLKDVTFATDGNKTNYEHEISPKKVEVLGTVINGVKTKQIDLKKEELITQGYAFNMQSINERKTDTENDRQYAISELLVPRGSKDKKTKK